MLAHSDAVVDADGPHHGTAMLGSFEEKILFHLIVAALGGGSAFVDIVPLVAVAGDGWKQARIVFGVCVYASSVRLFAKTEGYLTI